MAKNITCGIDVGTHTTRVVILEHLKDSISPTVLGTGIAPTSGMRLGYITNIDLISKSIKQAVSEAERIAGLKIKRSYVSVGGISLDSCISFGSVIISKADKEVTHLDVSKALVESEENLELLNKKIIHIIPLMYKLDGKEIHGRPEGMKGAKLEVKTLFVTCLKQNIEDMVTAMAISGIEIQDIIASPIASSFVLLGDKQKTAGCGLVDIGSETVSLAVFENNTLMSIKVFPIGSMEITKDVALGLRIALEEAESIKVGSVIGDYPKKKVEEIIEARLNDIFELVDNHLKHLKRNGLLPAGIIIVGGGSEINKIEEIARTQLKLPIRVTPSDASINNKLKVRGPSWYTALGLALSQGENKDNISLSTSFGDNIKQVRKFFKSLLSQLLP